MAGWTDGKYVSIDRVMDKVYRDLPFPEDIDWVDCIEWAGEALDMIRIPKMYYSKICCLDLKNHRAKLPDDLTMITQVRDGNTQVAMHYATDTFHKIQDEIRCEPNDPEASQESDFQTMSDVYNAGKQLEFSNFTGDDCSDDVTYTVDKGYIFTPWKTGKLEIAYKAYPLDDEGIPMIPDDEKVVQGVKSYICERIGMKLWMLAKIPGPVYQKLEQERAFYMGAASTSLQMPSIDQMEGIKNDWLRLIPKINHHGTFFQFQQRAEKMRTHNSYSSLRNSSGRTK